VVKDKAKVQKTERAKLQQFQDSVRKKLAKLRRDTEASVTSLGGRSAEFPTNASLSDFFEWFRTEVMTMPTAFTECNENVTCYVLIGVFQMLAGEGCEHLSELKKTGSFLRCFGPLGFPCRNRPDSEAAHEELVD
jgi:hypothetical protein